MAALRTVAKLRGSVASAYWIETFLTAKLAISPGQGTQVLAEAVAAVARRVRDSAVQAKLIAGALALFNSAGERVTFEGAVRRLPQEVREDVLEEIEKAYPRDATFTLEEDTLNRSLGSRELRLDTGVIVAGPNRNSDRLVAQRETTRNRVELRTVGQIVETRVKRGRAGAA